MIMSLKIECSDDNVSVLGCFLEMNNFNDELGFKQIFNALPIPQSTSNNHYEPYEIIENFLVLVWPGC
jgi:hypothetical protein